MQLYLDSANLQLKGFESTFLRTTLDSKRHAFNRQRRKKLKKTTTQKKLMPPHIAHILFCLPTHQPPKGKIKKVQSPTH